MFRRFLKRLFLPPLIVLAALWMFIEEWLWNHLVTFTQWVARAPFFRWIEARLAKLSPYGAMAVLFIPALLLLPIKIAALYFIAHGRAATGVMVIIGAKILGTAVVARLFTVCRPALLSIQWFRRLFEGILRLKARLYGYIKSSAAWRAAVRSKNYLKSWLPRGGRFRRMWRALGEVLRRKVFGKKPQPQPPETIPTDPAPPVLPTTVKSEH